MHELLFGGDSQSAGNLQPDIQSFDRFKRTLPLDTRLKGLAVDELHDIEVLVLLWPQIKHGVDIRMAQSGRSARLPKKPLARCLAIEVGGIDHLQGYGKAKVRVVRLVRDAHGSPTQFPKAAILPFHKLIVMVALNRVHDGIQNTPKPSVRYKESCHIAGFGLRVCPWIPCS